MNNCTYRLTLPNGEEREIKGKAAMKAFLVQEGMATFFPNGFNPNASTLATTDLNAMFNDVLAEEIAKDEAKAQKQRAPKAPAKPRTASQAAASAAKNTAAALVNAIDGLSALFGQTPPTDGTINLNSGIPVKIDAETYAKAKPLFQQAIANLGDAGSDLKEAMRAVVRMVLDKSGIQAARNMQPYVVQFIEDVQNERQATNGEQDVPSATDNLESDSSQPGTERAVVYPVQGDAGAVPGNAGSPGGSANREAGGGQPGGAGLSTGGAAAGGERGDFGVYRGDPAAVAARVASGADFSERGSDVGFDGVRNDPIPAAEVDRVAVTGNDRLTKERLQRQADATPVKPGDLENVKATLPYLLEGQQEDVFKAETRFAKPDGYGMLFTNGTGTGKTFTGLGVVKRMTRQGRGNILIVVPDEKIMDDWRDSGKALGLDITPLADTKDAGKGLVVTTYANLGQNDALARRQWDMVVADEAHELMKSADGKVTTYLANLRAITHHPDGASQRHTMLNRKDIDALAKISEQITANTKILNNTDTMEEMMTSVRAENTRLQKEADALAAKLREASDAVRAEVASMQGDKRARLLALSATPFAYEFTVDWANGYLFDYNEGQASDRTEFRGYNQGSNKDRFFMTHFGYSMRYNKLTKPDPSKVDTGLLQRNFNTHLRKTGALSSRMLDVQADYDRRFVLVDSAIGNQIDDALNWISEKRREAGREDMGFATLGDLINEKFDHLSRRYLLEAIKATEVVPIVRQHMALGRKVVVFHDYKKGGGFNPFDIKMPGNASESASAEEVKALNNFRAAVAEFRSKFKTLVNAPLGTLDSPIEVFKREFPDVLLVNGDEKKSALLDRYKKFQDDASGPQVMLVQSAKNKGWSGHDTTGKHQRVLINLGQPTAPTTAIQQEGRIYRTGQVTDAIMRYLNTGTSWEKTAFAQTIAGRASAAENLGMGEQARALKDSFISAFEESDSFPPGHDGEGKGGKERDKLSNAVLTAYDRAKTYYWATQKKNSKTKAQEGKDYFATPEPVGYKMAEWLDLRGGESSLEPSAGHGAIARWLPENTNRTAIEPSNPLRARLAMAMDASRDRLVDGTFEEHAIVNKYDGIAMNPPFGVGGKTAIEHLTKAANHLRDGGRIVALIPTGPAADKRFDQWMYGESERPSKPIFSSEAAGEIHRGDTVEYSHQGYEWKIVVSGIETSKGITNGAGRPTKFLKGKNPLGLDGGGLVDNLINLPEGASIKVTPGPRTETYRAAENLYMVGEVKLPSATFERAGTNVATRIVIIDKQTDGSRAPQQTRNIDLSNATDIKELFDRLEEMSMPPRVMTQAQQAQANADKAQAPSQPVAPQVKTPKAANPDAVGTVDRGDAEIIEHVTKKGKTLRGIIKTDLLREEAEKIDPYTFRKDGGWFIRQEYLKPEGGDIAFSRKDESPLAQEVREAAAALDAANEMGDAMDRADPDTITLEDFMSAGEARMNAEKAMVEALARAPDDGFAVEGLTPDGRMLVVTPSASEPGRWQLTRFGRDGEPWGDTRFNTKEMALKYMVEEAIPSSLRHVDAAFSRGAGNAYAGVNWVESADQSAATIVANAIRADNQNQPGTYAYTIVEPARGRLGAGFGNSGAARAQNLTDAVSRKAREFGAAFGRRVVFVRPDRGSPSFFNGFILAKSDPNTIYVNINADVNLMSILGHEFYEGLLVQNPKLHNWFVNETLRHIKDGALDTYFEKLKRSGDKQDFHGKFKELLADFTGDALADPEFRRSLEQTDQSKFRQLIRAFRNFLIQTLSKMRARVTGSGLTGDKALGSEQYFKDVQALRDVLRKVIQQSNSGGNLKTYLENGGAMFSRGAESQKVVDDAETASELRQEGLDTRVQTASGKTWAFDRFAEAGIQKGSATQAMKDAVSLTGLDLGLKVEISDDLPDAVPMSYDHQADVVYVNRTFAHSPRWQMAQWMAEEVLHALDSARPGRMLSANAAAFDFNSGSIANEVAEHFAANGPLSDWLAYPLAQKSMTQSVVKAELFARLGVIYFGQPKLLRRHLPKAYEAYHETFNLGSLTGGGDADQSLSAEVHRARNPVWNPKAGGRYGNDPQAQRGDAESRGERSADPGLERLYSKLRKNFGASRLGGIVQFSQSLTRSTNKATAQDFKANGDFDPANPDIRYSRMAPDDTASQAWQAPSLEDASHKLAWDNMTYALQDKLIDTKRVVQAIQEAGGELKDQTDVYLQEELYHARVSHKSQEFVQKELTPMVQALSSKGIELPDFETYLHARHAPEANRVMKERNPNEAEIEAKKKVVYAQLQALGSMLKDEGAPAKEKARVQRLFNQMAGKLELLAQVKPWTGSEEDRQKLSGMSDDEARAVMAKLTPEQARNMAEVAAMFDAIVKKNRQEMVDYDLEDQDTVDGWGQMFKFYVPLMREDDGNTQGTGQGFSIKGRETKSRTGSTRKVVDIVANLAMQRERLIVRGEKNRVSQALVGLASANPNPDFWKVGAPDMERKYDPRTNSVKLVANPNYKNLPNVVTAKLRGADGKVSEVAVVFNEDDNRAKRMAESLKNLDGQTLEGLWAKSATITRYLAAMSTQYNPFFGVINLARDVQGAAIYLDGTPLADKKKQVAASGVKAVIDIYRAARADRKNQPHTGEWGQWWDMFQEDGGPTGYRDIFKDSNERTKAIAKTMNPDAWMESAFGKVATANGLLKDPASVAKKGGGWVFDWLSDYNLAMENGIRVATYRAAVESGMSRQRAAALAKNITVNFNRKGQMALKTGALYAFFNAAVQGTARMGEALITMEPGKPKTMRLSPLGKKVVYGGMLLGSMQAALLAAAGFDDENPPDFVRERNLIIPTGGGRFVTIPMPLGLHVFPGIGRHLTEFTLSGGKEPQKRVIDMTAMMFSSFYPLGGAGMSLQTFAPTFFDPIVALKENKDYAGRPIARESMDPNVPGHELTRTTATWFSQGVSELINRVTGGDKYVAGVVSPTPDQIDYLIGQATGGVGRELLKFAQTGQALATGEELPMHKVPLLGRFFGSANGGASQSGPFYAKVNEAKRLDRQIDGLREDGQTAKAMELQRSNAYLLAKARVADSQVTRLRREKRQLLEKGAPRAQVQEVERRMSEAMRRFNEATAN